jgi:hypothetical protein
LFIIFLGYWGSVQPKEVQAPSVLPINTRDASNVRALHAKSAALPSMEEGRCVPESVKSVVLRQPSFTDQLEARARHIVRSRAADRAASPVLRDLDAQLALALDQLDAARATHRHLNTSIERERSNIRVAIGQRSPRPPFYYDTRLPERDMLRGRLMRLEREQRGLEMHVAREVQELEQQIADLARRRTMLQAR